MNFQVQVVVVFLHHREQHAILRVLLMEEPLERQHIWDILLQSHMFLFCHALDTLILHAWKFLSELRENEFFQRTVQMSFCVRSPLQVN